MKCDSFLPGILLGIVACATYPVVPSARAAGVVEVATVGNPNPIAWPGLIAEHVKCSTGPAAGRGITERRGFDRTS